MYSVAADQPLYCIDNGQCVSCQACTDFKNDPGNVRGYMSMGDCQVSLMQSLAMVNSGGEWSGEPTESQLKKTPKCACD
jgi:hypothetical protein